MAMASATIECTLVVANTIFVSYSLRNTTAVHCPHGNNKIGGVVGLLSSTNDIDFAPRNNFQTLVHQQVTAS